MVKSGTDKHQSVVAVRKCTNDLYTAAYLAIHLRRQAACAATVSVFSKEILYLIFPKQKLMS